MTNNNFRNVSLGWANCLNISRATPGQEELMAACLTAVEKKREDRDIIGFLSAFEGAEPAAWAGLLALRQHHSLSEKPIKKEPTEAYCRNLLDRAYYHLIEGRASGEAVAGMSGLYKKIGLYPPPERPDQKPVQIKKVIVTASEDPLRALDPVPSAVTTEIQQPRKRNKKPDIQKEQRKKPDNRINSYMIRAPGERIDGGNGTRYLNTNGVQKEARFDVGSQIYDHVTRAFADDPCAARMVAACAGQMTQGDLLLLSRAMMTRSRLDAPRLTLALKKEGHIDTAMTAPKVRAYYAGLIDRVERVIGEDQTMGLYFAALREKADVRPLSPGPVKKKNESSGLRARFEQAAPVPYLFRVHGGIRTVFSEQVQGMRAANDESADAVPSFKYATPTTTPWPSD